MAEGKATTVRFAETVYQRLEKASRETGLPMNSIVVVAVLDWLESHPPELAGRGTRGFEWAFPPISVPPLGAHPVRRLARRSLPWPGSPRAFEQFSRSAQAALTDAHRAAEAEGAQYIGTGQLLFALSNHGLARRILGRTDVLGHEIAGLLRPVEAGATRASASLLLPSSRVKTVVRLALDEAGKDGLDYVGTEHLLLGILLEGESSAARLLAQKNVTEQRIREEIDRLRSDEEG